jgi:class I fructose-bisphosphate aldolase/fructose-bisphosphate aldolase/2-amino-3,7-dideoxy-D-threo-hept-6-ulosonate synthase
MVDSARLRRWSRFVDRASGRALIVPIDHGLTLGPIRGLERLEDIARWLSSGLITGVIVHKGLAERLGPVADCGMMIHLNGSLSLDENPDRKILLTSILAAVRLGADAVSVQTNFSAATAAGNLRLLGEVVDEAHLYGLPVLAMVYDKAQTGNVSEDTARIRHFIRAAIELGVDAVKIGPPEDLTTIPEVLDGVSSHTPVVFAGGALTSDEQLFALTRSVVQCGATGVCVGRNVFQREDPRAIMSELLHTLRRENTLSLPAQTWFPTYFGLPVAHRLRESGHSSAEQPVISG